MVTATRKTDAYLDEDEDFEDGVCKPGESIRCPLYLCDATQCAIAFDARGDKGQAAELIELDGGDWARAAAAERPSSSGRGSTAGVAAGAEPHYVARHIVWTRQLSDDRIVSTEAWRMLKPSQRPAGIGARR